MVIKIKSSESVKNRIQTMDELRGFAIICMVFFHAFFTMYFLFDMKWGGRLLRFFSPAQMYFACGFIIISGISSRLSRSNIKRGAKLVGIAIVITLVTCIFFEGNEIYFGILHLLSVCMILADFIIPVIDRIPISASVAVNALLFYMTYNITDRVFHIPFYKDIRLPGSMYQSDWLSPLGFCTAGFESSDYFPILPFIFMFFIGLSVGKLAKEGKFPKFLYKSRVPFLAFAGRHTLIIYIAHQPIIYAILLLYRYIFR